MRLTNDHGQTMRPMGARPLTDDGRLLWVGPMLPHEHGEFLLDGLALKVGGIEQALAAHRRSAPPS